MYNIGDVVIFEIIWDLREYKGAIATAESSFIGRFMVFKGMVNGVSVYVSKKLSVVMCDLFV